MEGVLDENRKKIIWEIEDESFGICRVYIDIKGNKISEGIYSFETVVDDNFTFYGGDYIDYYTTKREFRDLYASTGLRHLLYKSEDEEILRKDLSKFYNVLIRSGIVSLKD